MQDRLKSFLKNVKMNESVLSMLLGAITIVVVGMLVFNFYKQNQSADIADTGEQTEGVEKVGDVPVVERDGQRYPASLPESYTVAAGDHLWDIAERHYGSGYNWVDIARENDLRNPHVLLVGQELRLPDTPVIVIEEPADPAYTLSEGQEVIEGDTYTVVEGDNLWDISVRAYQDGYRWPELARVNELSNPNYVEVGQVLSIPR